MNETRLNILNLLFLQKSLTLSEISEILGFSKKHLPLISFHLKTLEEHNLVKKERHKKYYLTEKGEKVLNILKKLEDEFFINKDIFVIDQDFKINKFNLNLIKKEITSKLNLQNEIIENTLKESISFLRKFHKKYIPLHIFYEVFFMKLLEKNLNVDAISNFLKIGLDYHELEKIIEISFKELIPLYYFNNYISSQIIKNFIIYKFLKNIDFKFNYLNFLNIIGIESFPFNLIDGYIINYLSTIDKNFNNKNILVNEIFNEFLLYLINQNAIYYSGFVLPYFNYLIFKLTSNYSNNFQFYLKNFINNIDYFINYSNNFSKKLVFALNYNEQFTKEFEIKISNDKLLNLIENFFSEVNFINNKKFLNYEFFLEITNNLNDEILKIIFKFIKHNSSLTLILNAKNDKQKIFSSLLLNNKFKFNNWIIPSLVSLNLPLVSYFSKKNEDIFKDLINEIIEEIFKIFIIKENFLNKFIKHSSSNTFLDYIKTSEKSYYINLVGIFECLFLLTGKTLLSDSTVSKLLIEILREINKVVNEKSIKHDIKVCISSINDGVSPYKFVNNDLKDNILLPKLIRLHIRRAGYSYNILPDWFPLKNPLEKIQIESKFIKFLEGGYNLNIWFDEKIFSFKDFVKIINEGIKFNVPNLTFNTIIGYCKKCKKRVEIMESICKYCKSDKVYFLTRFQNKLQLLPFSLIKNL